MISVIMPMAGAGSRFRIAGEYRPKPLIEIEGIPMAVWALRGLARMVPDLQPILVVLREHVERFSIDSVLGAHIPKARFAVAEALTGGSLETCMLAQDAIGGAGNLDKPIVALDCDLAFRSTSFAEALTSLQQPEAPDGALLSFRSTIPRYSFAEVVDGWVRRTAEKEAISDRALVGAYGFRRASTFFDIAREIIADNARVGNGEFYISAAYNRLISRGGRVALTDVDDYWSFGTPEELASSLAATAFLPFLHEIASPPGLAG